KSEPKGGNILRNRKVCPNFYGVSFLRNPVKLLRSILSRGQYVPESDRKSYTKGSVSAGMPCASYVESNSASLNNRRNQGVNFLRCMQFIISGIPVRLQITLKVIQHGFRHVATT